MGVIIFTADDADYRDSSTVHLGRVLSTPPVAPNTTYILHSDKFNESDVLYWAPVINYRLVVVCTKPPKLTDKSSDYVIVDRNLNKPKPNFNRPIDGLFKWSNRIRVWGIIKSVPLPLLSSFLLVNSFKDVELGRRIARCKYSLPDEYLYASITYSVCPSREAVVWPSKQSKPYELPSDFRQSDKYAEAIIKGVPQVTNDLRHNSEALPKGVNKTVEAITEWI